AGGIRTARNRRSEPQRHRAMTVSAVLRREPSGHVNTAGTAMAHRLFPTYRRLLLILRRRPRDRLQGPLHAAGPNEGALEPPFRVGVDRRDVLLFGDDLVLVLLLLFEHFVETDVDRHTLVVLRAVEVDRHLIDLLDEFLHLRHDLLDVVVDLLLLRLHG